MKLPVELREEIIRRVRANPHQLQKEIARDLNLDTATVGKVEKEIGAQRHPGYSLTPAQHAKIVSLLAEEHGAPYIAKTLRIPQHVVQKTMRLVRHKLERGAVGYKYGFQREELRLIARELREAEREIAARWRVRPSWLRRFRREHVKNHRGGKPKPRTLEPTRGLALALVNALPPNVPLPDETVLVNSLTANFLETFRRQVADAVHQARLMRAVPDEGQWKH